jgi:hypothetical protein
MRIFQGREPFRREMETFPRYKLDTYDEDDDGTASSAPGHAI